MNARLIDVCWLAGAAIRRSPRSATASAAASRPGELSPSSLVIRISGRLDDGTFAHALRYRRPARCRVTAPWAAADTPSVIRTVPGPGLSTSVAGHDSDLPRAFRTAYSWSIHAADCRSRYSSWTCRGVRY